MADLSKVKVGTTYYNLKDAAARESIAANASAIDAEVSRATGVESGLDTRITNLEARGRFLSNYNVGTGLPTTYPEVPSSQSTYTYTFKSGDYYIVGSVPASGTKYMPDGAAITYDASKDPKWTVGKKETTDTISVGDQFVFDGTNWVHIAAAKDVAWGSIVGTLSNQTDLQAALDAKADSDDLGALAYKASATGSTTLSTVDSITMKKSTVAGDATVTFADATATLTKADYTPAGTVSGKTTAAGTVAVVLNDATAEGSITYGSYTPAGTIAATATGSFSALKSATFQADDDGVQIEGTISKPDITVTPTTQSVIQAVSAAAVLPTFSEGTFSAGDVTFGTFNGGSATVVDTTKFSGGSLASATTDTFASEGIVASVNAEAKESDPDYECLVFSTAATASAVTAQGAFTAAAIESGFYTAGAAATWTGSSYTAPSKAADTFTQGSAATFSTVEVVKSATAALAETPAFTGGKYKVATQADTALKEVAFAGTSADIKATKVEYLKQGVSSATFTGTEAAITASFSGSTAASILTTGVTYSKADASAAFSVDVTPEVSAITSSAKTIEITVS